MIVGIAGLPIEWQNEHKAFVEDFVTDSGVQPVISIRFEKNLPECHGIQYSCKGTEHTLRLENGELLFANKDWSNVSAYFTAESGGYALPLAAICSRFSYFGALLAHASCVSVGENGVLFTGFSGDGKTTQAKLWKQYNGAQIINGDKIFIREINGVFYGCGLPWKGSSEFCLNRKTELKAIVILKKSKENKLTRLDSDKAAKLLIPHVFMPYWDDERLADAFDIFEKIVQNLSVFMLECRADEDAAKYTYKELFG